MKKRYWKKQKLTLKVLKARVDWVLCSYIEPMIVLKSTGKNEDECFHLQRIHDQLSEAIHE
jgi:hypothetical protein